MYKNKFLSLLLVFSLVICGTMGTGKGAKAEENVTTEESGSVEEEEPCEEPEEDIDLKVNITAMWDHHYNAEVVDEDRGYFDNMGYNQNIEPGQSVSFGFIAECDGDEVEVYDHTLYEMITIPEELEGNPNWEEVTEDELAQYEFEPEEFETEQDYYDYLERQKRRGILDEEQKVKLQSRTQIQTKSEKVEAADKPIKAMDTLTLNKSDIKFTIVNAGKYATQTFYLKTKEGYAYLSQRKDKEVVISKCIIDKNNKINLKECVSQMHLTGFDHGQSLEMFSYGGNEYLMVTAGKLPKHSMGNKVAFIQYRKGSYCYGQYKNEKAIQAKILCKAGYANKQKKREGIPKQVEVALSEDKSTLLVWSQVAHKKNEGRKIQLTCYDLKKVMKQLINVEKKVTKKNKKNKMNDMVRLSFQKIDSKACITTALQTDKNKNIVKPYNSIQSIDLANGSSGKYKVYICGGNDKKQRKLSIATMRLSKGTDITKNSKYLCRQNVKLDKSIFDDIKEMEGMHYRGSLRFVIAPATGSKIGKSTQYLFEIDASRVEK